MAAFSPPGRAEEGLSSYQAIVSVADQKIAVVRDGAVVAKYPISTSRFGVGDSSGSYKTPLGKMRVFEKLGDNLPAGAVIKHQRATGEVLTVNAPGRDPIVTRILWLDGMEASNAHAKDRKIYIHGTPEEKLIGRPASYGCIRMRSQDVIALYKELGVGSTVSVIPDKLPRLAKYEPPKPTPAPKVEVAKVTPAVPAKPDVAKAAAVAPASPKVLAAIAEAKEREVKAERQAKLEREEQAEQELKASREQKAAARVAKTEPLASPTAKADKAARPSAPTVAKLEKAPAPAATAKADKPAAEPPAIAAAPASAGAYSPPRLALARERLAKPRPIVVPPPVDPDRLQFLKSHDSNLAAMRVPAEMSERANAPTTDLSVRMKGSILESGLPASGAGVR